MWSAPQTRKMGRRAAGFRGGLFVALLLLAALPAAAAFVDPINLSSSPSISARPAIAVNGAGQVFAAWREGADIFFARSQPTQGSCTGPGPLKFEVPLNLLAGFGSAIAPAVSANDSGGVFVAWQASSGIWFRASTNGGQTFLPPLNLSQNSGPATSPPSVAADNAGGVFVAWSGGGAPAEILFRRSFDSGNTFQPALIDVAANLSRTPLVDSRAPSVATDGSNIFLAWQEGNPMFKSSIPYRKFGRSDDLAIVAGLTPLDLLTGTALTRVFNPSLAFGDDGILSVAFGSPNGPSVYHRSLSNGGTTFGPLEDLSGLMLSPTADVRAARRNGSPLVAWAERLAGNGEIRYRLLGNGAMAGPQTVSPTPGLSGSPAVAIDSAGRLLVAWQETVQETLNLNNEIYLSYSGGSGGGTGTMMEATVWAKRRVLDLRDREREDGERHHTQGHKEKEEDYEREDGEEDHEREEGKHWTVKFFIELPDGSAGAIDLTTLKLNGQPVMPAKSAVGDKNHNGIPDLKLKFKFKWSDLQSIFDGAGLTAAQRNGNITVTGSTRSGGCFSGSSAVRIKR